MTIVMRVWTHLGGETRYALQRRRVSRCAIDHGICDERQPCWDRRLLLVMLRLDTVSCALTVLSTVLVGRKMWGGLVVAGVNSVVICVIGARTGQFGFIPANLFCIGVYAVSLRSWMGSRSQSTDLRAQQ